jgi:hypothetical protein
MPNWKKVIVSGSNASVNSLYAQTSITASVFSGSAFTGSLLGTASYASYALTASSAQNASDILIYVKNSSGAQINKGRVVRITGAVGDNPLIGTASYFNDNESANTLGITYENIANDSFGYVITEGTLLGINTDAFTASQLIYLGDTGSIIGTAPVAPLHAVRLGQVLRSQLNNGSIYVRIDNGYELGELHDVRDTTTTGSYGDLLVKSGSIWINSKQLTGSYGLTGSLQATSFTGSLLGTASFALNALTASFVQNAVSSSFASTASFVTTAQTASYVLNAVSASFASTASFVNTLNQPVIISGSLTVFTGSAVEFQVTNTGVRMGNIITDAHTVTGSFNVSGSVTLTGSLSLLSGSITATSILNPHTITNTRSLSNGGALFIYSQNSTSSFTDRGLTISSAPGAFYDSRVDIIRGRSDYFAGLKVNGVGETGSAAIPIWLFGQHPEYGIGSSWRFGLVASNGTANNDVINVTPSTLNIQIGNRTDAGYKLDVQGTLRNTTDAYLNTTSGNTSIGKTTANAKLDVNGSAVISGSFTVITGSAVEFQVTNTGVRIGNVITDTHTITGSLNVSGSVTATNFTGSLFGTSSWANNATTASYVLNAVSSSFASTASFVANAQTASYVLNAVSSSFATSASTAQTASYVLQAVSSSFASTASFVTTAQTASYVLNAVSASFASTASSVNTLNQNVIITGSLTVGATSVGANENTLILGPAPGGGAGEGGQLLLQAKGDSGYTSASMLDNWQNQTRLLRGTNAGSDAVIASFNMHSKQVQFPAYTGSGAFSGTATANLSVDSGGNIITTAIGSALTGGSTNYIARWASSTTLTTGSLFDNGTNVGVGNQSPSYKLDVSGDIRSTGAVYANANGTMYFRGGDDAELWDINVANTVGLYGQQDQTVGSLKLGSGGGTISGRSGNIGIGTINPTSASLQVNGNVFATSFTGSLLGTASFATTATSASFAATSSFAASGFTIGISQFQTATVASSIVGANNLFTTPTGSFTGAKYLYTVTSGSNARMGEIFAIWNGGTAQFTDVSTLDIGSTTVVTASVTIVTAQAQLNFQTNTSGWTIKSQATFI